MKCWECKRQTNTASLVCYTNGREEKSRDVCPDCLKLLTLNPCHFAEVKGITQRQIKHRDERDSLGYDTKTLEALKPLLTTIHAQLCGIRMKEGKTPWRSALDTSIDELTVILKEREMKQRKTYICCNCGIEVVKSAIPNIIIKETLCVECYRKLFKLTREEK